MDQAIDLKNKTVQELEEWFLSHLDKEPLPLEGLSEAINLQVSRGCIAQADAWVEFLLEALSSKADRAGTLHILQQWSQRHEQAPEFLAQCKELASKVFTGRAGAVLIECAGFDQPILATEAIRRLRVLFDLAEGVYCYDKTWGFGVVRRVDEFYRRVDIDFRKKPRHQMTFAYAAEALQVLPSDHFLVTKHKDPDALIQLAKDNPAELVRQVLKGFGPTNVNRLRELLDAEGVVPDADWKPFWDQARKGLATDPLVSIPQKRSDPIRLMDKPRAYDNRWFEGLQQERDWEKILTSLTELCGNLKPEQLDASSRAIIQNRLKFALSAVTSKRALLTARIVVIGSRLLGWFVDSKESALPPEEVRAAAQGIFAKGALIEALSGISAKDLDSFLTVMGAFQQESLTGLLLELMPELPITPLSQGIEFLQRLGMGAEVDARLKALLASRIAGPAVLYWVARHLDETLRIYPEPRELVLQMLDVLQEDFAGEMLRAQNQLRDLFGVKDWFAGFMERMDPDSRTQLVRKINLYTNWNAERRREIMARMVLLYPELKNAISTEHPKEGSVEAVRPTYTSWRSYRTRQAQLRHMIEKDIPANSRDIAHARSYGDLRENFEYQAAKDHQRLLMQRQAELEQDLRTVQGTDFTLFPTDKAGIGTRVSLRFPDGAEKTYCILGEWDRDEPLNIISSGSRLAQVLDGHRSGEDVLIPEANGEVICRILGVSGLSEEIQAWVNASPERETP